MKEVTKWESEDGKLFGSKRECEYYELQKKTLEPLKKLVFKYDNGSMSNGWFLENLVRNGWQKSESTIIEELEIYVKREAEIV